MNSLRNALTASRLFMTGKTHLHIITCEMLNKLTGEGINGMGALFGWAHGLKLTEPLPKHEIRHYSTVTINPINKDHPCMPHTEYWHLGMLIDL